MRLWGCGQRAGVVQAQHHIHSPFAEGADDAVAPDLDREIDARPTLYWTSMPSRRSSLRPRTDVQQETDALIFISKTLT
jgi:hypothetical protein